ncbi:MAG: Asp-tRNA(Asn)/Glu-tRNA(Gln) amidotransferase subunit GatA [Candidatus Gracilibacteria bacterium]
MQKISSKFHGDENARTLRSASCLAALTIREAHDGLVAQKFSAKELAESCLERIKKYNPQLNAFITVTEEEALASAARTDAKIAKKEKIGQLEGLPCAIKDLFNTKGVLTTCASPGQKTFVPPYDATAVELLRKEGMVMVGKTNLDEHACGSSTEHSCFGPTHNPWDLERVAGGSSGGSAAAVSADLCTYAIGTDTGGSIRQPGSLCSVPALKVTYGRVSRFGVTAMASSWDTVGPFGKRVEDVAFVLQALAKPDLRDTTMPSVPAPDYVSLLTGDVKGLKIGVPKEYFSEGVTEEVKQLVWDAIRHLEKKGAVVREISLPMTQYAVALYYILMPAELSANLARFDGIRFGSKPDAEGESLIDYYYHKRGEGFSDEIKRRIMIGTYVLSAGYYDAYYRKAQKVRTKILQEFNAAFEEVDVLCAPTSPYPAFKINEKMDDPLAMYMADALTIPGSTAGIPGLSVPCGFSKTGLPVGLQIMGPQFEEGRVLRVGDAYERSTEWWGRKPKMKD